MILTGPEIRRQVALGRITIDPFETENVNPNSYNYRLGTDLVELPRRTIDPKREPQVRHVELSERGYILRPGLLYLAHTREKIGSPHYVTSLIGRSTIGRLGLWLQITADLGHLGSEHHWTLELKVVQPLRVYPGMQIGQVTFWKTQGSRRHQYNGKYARDIRSEPSRIRVEFR